MKDSLSDGRVSGKAEDEEAYSVTNCIIKELQSLLFCGRNVVEVNKWKKLRKQEKEKK